MSQPFDNRCRCKALGKVDRENGQFWVSNPWLFTDQPFNLSCYERNRVYANVGGSRCLDVSWLTGADDDGDSRGAIGADLAGDGMPDVVLTQIGGGPLKIYLNRYPKTSWLQVSLRGVDSNSLGLGARLEAEVSGRVLRRDLWSADTYWAQGPAQVLFGLGDAKKVDRLTIRWPSGKTQVLKDLAVDRHVRIVEGKDEVQEIRPPAPPPR